MTSNKWASIFLLFSIAGFPSGMFAEDLTGVVRVVSVPDRAVVILNGERVPTKTPVRITSVDRTKCHQLEVQSEGHLPWREEFCFGKESNKEFMIKLQPMSRLSLQEVKKRADQEARRLEYRPEAMKAQFDETNSAWIDYSNKVPDLAVKEKLKGKDFAAVYYGPKQDFVLGGDLWVFIDRKTGDVVAVLRGQ